MRPEHRKQLLMHQRQAKEMRGRRARRVGMTGVVEDLRDVHEDRATVSLAQYKGPKKAREEFKKAESALNDRKTEEAEKHLAKALEIHPEYADALTMRGIMNLEQKNYDAAISDLDHAIKADPGYAMAYIAMGATFNMTQRFDEALQSLDRGVALAPQSWQAYFEMAKAQVGKSK